MSPPHPRPLFTMWRGELENDGIMLCDDVSGRVALISTGTGPRRIVLRQDVRHPVTLLPVRDRRFALALRHELRPLDEGVVVDVARAVREHFARADPDDELRLGIMGHERIVLVYARF